MNTQVYIGLAVTSHDQGTLSTATFDNISINGATLPAAPTNLVAQAVSGDTAGLTWANQDTSNFGFDVYREDPGSSTYALIATLPSSAVSFTDTGLTPGDSYSYQVTAVNTVGQSVPSTAATVVMPVVPTAPSTLQFNSVTTTSAGLSWLLNSSNDMGVNVYRRAASASTFTLIATLPAGTTNYVDNDLQPGTLYEYHVTAFDVAGESAAADTGLTSLPVAPTNVTAVRGEGQVTLNWTAPVGALAYNIYRGLSPGGEDASAYASGIDSTSFVDHGTDNSTLYYYTITAVDFSGQSASIGRDDGAIGSHGGHHSRRA